MYAVDWLFLSSAVSAEYLVTCIIRYDNYGGDWASYNFTAVQQWIQSFNVCEFLFVFCVKSTLSS